MKKSLLSLLFAILMIALIGCQTTPEEPETFTVSFDTSGGTVIAEQTVEAGALVTEPTAPHREGFIFTGIWLHGETPWDFAADVVNEDLTLTAFFVGEEEEVPVETVAVTVEGYDLPEENNADDRPEVALGTTLTFTVSFTPVYASEQGYTLSTSNSRAVVDGNTITFVYGITGPGNVSVFVNFDDVGVDRLEYRFLTVPAVIDGIAITHVLVTAEGIELPAANNQEDRPRVAVGTVFTLDVALLPENATNPNYTITASNTRAEVDGHTVTIVYGEEGPGRVSIRVFFEDGSVGIAGMLEYRFDTYEEEELDVDITEVIVTTVDLELPEPNNIDDRPTVEIGTVMTLAIDILPEDASNQNYTITASNSRAVVDGHTVTFVYGATGPGNVSIRIVFEDSSVGVDGLLEYRFLTVEGAPPEVNIDSVSVTSEEIDLPAVNDIDDRPMVAIGTIITLLIDILPEDASNQNYTITSSNSRAVVDGHTVTFVYGNTGPGSVSIRINFTDTTVGNNGLLEYRFSTFEPEPEA